MPEEKFKHTTYFKRADLNNKAFVYWSPSISDWRDIIEDYIQISKKRKNNKLAMFKLQMELISDLLQLNDALKGYMKLYEDPEERKLKFPEKEISKETLDFWGREIVDHKIIINALKDVGDGIAWRIFNYNRALIYNICINNEDPGPLTLTQGFITELFSLGDFMNESEVLNCVYHGITNFLLISDLTILYENGELNFVEVKGKKTGRGQSWRERIIRQKQRVENIAQIANSNEGISSDIKVKFSYLDKKPETILNKLETLMKRCNEKVFVSQIYNSYLGVGIINFALAIDDSSWQDKVERIKKQIKKSKEDFVMVHTSIDWLIFSPNLAPLSIHPFPSEIIANILMGKYLIYYFFNVTQFYMEFEKKGWKVSDKLSDRKDKENFESMFTLTQGPLHITIPPLLYSRAVFEGLSVDSILWMCEDILNRGPDENNFAQFYGYSKEKYLWE